MLPEPSLLVATLRAFSTVDFKPFNRSKEGPFPSIPPRNATDCHGGMRGIRAIRKIIGRGEVACVGGRKTGRRSEILIGKTNPQLF